MKDAKKCEKKCVIVQGERIITFYFITINPF